ncbi:MAG: hypothetical protein O2960_04910 [Verrucomicrobia bacterium]|nr:hypothetical protein [Verrucomicrobiota bacterium]
MEQLDSDGECRGVSEGCPNAESWFTPWRFAIFLGFCLVAAFPSVWFGSQTFMFRDFGVLAYPVVHYHHEAFWRGEFPLWNPLSNCGVPFLAQWGTMVLYPFSLFYLLLPLPWSLNVFCLCHLFLAGFGMYFLTRRWTGGTFGAVLAGTAFVFNGVTLSCLIWPNYAVALGWMPWVVLLVERACKEGGRFIVGASIVSSLQLLAGVPELGVLTWLLVLGIWIQSFVRDSANRKSAALRIVAIVFLTACLIAAQLFPFLDLLAHSQRSVEFGTSKWSMSLWGLGNLVLPLFRCFLTAQGVYFQTGQEFMSSTYLGLPVLALAISAVASVRKSRVWLLAGYGVLGVLLALGESGLLFSWLKQVIPFLGIGRYPIKFILVTSFVVPLLAAYAIQTMRESSSSANPVQWRRLAGVSAGLIAVTGCLLWIGRLYSTEYDNWPAIWRCAAERTLVLVAVAGLFGARLVVRRTAIQGVVSLMILLVVVCDALTHVPNQNPTLPSYAVAPGLWELSNKKPPPRFGAGRVMISARAEDVLLLSSVPNLYDDFLGKRLALWSNLNLLERTPKVNGSATLQVREQRLVQTRLYAATNTTLQGLENFLGVSYKTASGEVVDWDSRTEFLPLITAGQKPVFANDDAALEALADPLFNPREVVFLPPELLEKTPIREATRAEVLSATADSHRIDVEVQAAEPSLLVVAQSFYHCWRAYVDGVPVPLWRGNVAFQVVSIPSGRHSVKFVYQDNALRLGTVISLMALAGACFYLVRRSRDAASRR